MVPVPDQLSSVNELPPNPLNDWGDATLKRNFANTYDGVSWGENVGANMSIKLHAMHQELVDRGISPVRALEEHSYTYES